LVPETESLSKEDLLTIILSLALSLPQQNSVFIFQATSPAHHNLNFTTPSFVYQEGPTDCSATFHFFRNEIYTITRPRHRWGDNIRMVLRETVWEDVDWMHLAQDRDHWRAHVNTVMNLQNSTKGLMSWPAVTPSPRRTLLYGVSELD